MVVLNGLELLADLVRRGVRFRLDGETVCVVDPERRIGEGEAGLLRSLKPAIRGLLRQNLPAARAGKACDAFEAADGVALCRCCAWGLAEHFWRRRDCTFFIGEPQRDRVCRRCGVPFLEHLGIAAS